MKMIEKAKELAKRQNATINLTGALLSVYFGDVTVNVGPLGDPWLTFATDMLEPEDVDCFCIDLADAKQFLYELVAS